MIIISHKNKIDEYLLSYINYISSMNYSAHTVNQYLKELKRFINTQRITGIKDLTKEKVYSYLMYCYEILGHTNNSRRRVISIIRSFNVFLHQRDYITINYLKYIDSPKRIKTLPKLIQDNDLKKIFSNIFKIDKSFLYRDHFILSILYGSGLRVSELTNLKEADIDVQKRRIRVGEGKGKIERFAPISELAIESYIKYKFNDYQRLKPLNINSHENNYLILNKMGNKITTRGIQYILSTIAKKLEINTISPHMFRHSFATSLMENGLQVHEIQILLGHKSIAATQIYLHVKPIELYKAIKNHHPLNHIKIINK